MVRAAVVMAVTTVATAVDVEQEHVVMEGVISAEIEKSLV